jgi:hypothetical protein
MKLNDVFNSDQPVASSNFYWSAQSGKSITLVFFTSATFSSGSQIVSFSGGVNIADGSAFAQSQLALTAATATQIFAASATRKVGTFQNTSGASVWVGNSTTTSSGSTIGIEVRAGDSFQWRNSAALYGYSVAGGNISVIEES